MLGSAEATPYDLRFRLLSIPVRVHPLFWLVMLFLSGQLDRSDFDLSEAGIFLICAFISILVHEMGHGLASRLMGDEPMEIVLYAMGGYCAFHQNRLTRWRRIFVLACGPGAGFLLLGLVLVYVFSTGMPRSVGLETAVADLIQINLVWGILNLFPLWPLDGGQIMGVGLGMISPRSGMRWAHTISLLTAGCIAVWLVSVHVFMMAIWFGYFGFINYQMLRAMHYTHQSSEDPEWWRR
jgi:Zn-dependent protease